MRAIILLFVVVLVFIQSTNAQNDGVIVTGFGDNAQVRNPSAVLDVFSDDQGILAPRLTLAQRNAIVSPAHSLLIYQTDNTPGYYYNSGTPVTPVWERLAVASGVLTGSGTATQVAFWSGTSSLTSNANLFWDNTNSRLGIGTSGPLEALEIFRNGTNPVQLFHSSGVASYKLGNDGNVFKIAAMDNGFGGSVGNFAANDAQVIAITTVGNVGIGNVNGSHKLHVGEATADGQAITIRGYSNTPTSWKGGAAFGFSSASVIMGQLSGVAQIGGHNGALSAWADLGINAAGASGNVGIGTSAPGAKLHIGAFNDNHLLLTSSNNAYGWRMDTRDNGAGSVPLRIFKRTAGADTEVFTMLNQDGNVGIGATVPNQKLQVAGDINVNAGQGFRINNTATVGQFLRGDGTRFVSSAIQPTDIDYGNSSTGNPRAQGNFGQFQPHSTYSDFNTNPAYWGWNYVQGATNAPNATSSQWYREVLSLGSEYPARGGGGYSLELAFPRFNHSTAGVWMRTIEGGGIGGWTRIDAGSNNNNFIQNQYASAQTADYWITGLANVENAYRLDNVEVLGNSGTDVYGNIRVLRSLSTINDGMYIGYGGTGGPLRFFSNSGTTEFMSLTTGGNLGIGDPAPGARLEVEGISANWAEATPGLTKGSVHLDPGSASDHFGSALTWGASDASGGDNSQAGIYVRSDGSYGTKMYFGTTDDYSAGSKTRLMIDYNGNVGIGTTGPVSKLNVFGKTTMSRDNAGECCGNDATLALAESTSGTGRRAGISFHNGGVAEGTLELAGSGTRRLYLYDNQNIGMGLQMTGDFINQNVEWNQVTGANYTVAANSGQSVISNSNVTLTKTAGNATNDGYSVVLLVANVTASANDITWANGIGGYQQVQALGHGMAGFRVYLQRSTDNVNFTTLISGAAMVGMQVGDWYMQYNGITSMVGISGDAFKFTNNVSLNYVDNVGAGTYYYRLLFEPTGYNKSGGSYLISDRALSVVEIKR